MEQLKGDIAQHCQVSEDAVWENLCVVGWYCLGQSGLPRVDIRWSATAGAFVNTGDGTVYGSYDEARAAVCTVLAAL